MTAMETYAGCGAVVSAAVGTLRNLAVDDALAGALVAAGGCAVLQDVLAIHTSCSTHECAAKDHRLLYTTEPSTALCWSARLRTCCRSSSACDADPRHGCIVRECSAGHDIVLWHAMARLPVRNHVKFAKIHQKPQR